MISNLLTLYVADDIYDSNTEIILLGMQWRRS